MKTIGLVFSLAALAALAGCSNFPLYSEARDKQGQAVKKTWADVDVAATVAAARANQEALLKRQLEATDKLHAAMRENSIRQLATDRSATVEATLAGGATRALAAWVDGPGAAPPNADTLRRANEWVSAWNRNRRSLDALKVASLAMASTGLDLPPCSDILRGGDATRPIQKAIDDGGRISARAAQALEAARNACGQDGMTALEEKARTTSGSLRKTYDELQQARADLEAEGMRSRVLRNEYQAAAAAYADAVADKDKPGAAARLQEAVKRLQDAGRALAGLQDAFSVQFISAKELESINRFFTAATTPPAADGATAKSDAEKAGAIVLSLATFADDVRDAVKTGNTSALVPLAMHKEQLKIRFDAATRDIAAREAEVSLLQQKLELQTVQARSYAQIIEAFAPGSAGEPLAKKPFVAALRPLADTPDQPSPLRDAQNAVLRVTGMYLDSSTRLQSEVLKIHDRQAAAAAERELAYAEANAAQWQALIGSNVDQLATYGASGIKPEMLVSLLNSLTLIWIAVGVN